MEKTYRSIVKWGDKHEEILEEGVKALVKEKFGYTDDDFQPNYLRGDEEVILPDSKLPEAVVDSLIKICGKENVDISAYGRALHSYGYFYTDLLNLRKGNIATPPAAVVSPRTEEEIEEIVHLCNRKKIAITPVGGRSSVTRGVETPHGGISLDLSKHFNKVLEVNETNLTVTVQPGISGPELEKHLNSFGQGYTCGHFPQSFEYSCVGGWVAARGAGQESTYYGKIDNLVLSLKIIAPAGVIETKTFPASAEGWDLMRTFIGSEGALGVITRVVLKIKPNREEQAAYASFIMKDFESATKCMRQIMQSETGYPALFRISDPDETATAFKIKGFDNSKEDKILKVLGYKPGKRCLMFISLKGDADRNQLMKKKIKKIAKKNGGFSTGKKPVVEWLGQRYSSSYLRDPLMDIGIMTDTVETAVMWDQLVPLWKAVRRYLFQRDKIHVMTHISHVYENGANLYFTFLSPMKKGKEMEDYLQLHKGLIDSIHQNGGSLSHHHGIGRALAPWMEEEIGKTGMGMMQAVKDFLDPKGIMNPGNTLGLH